MIWRDIHYEDAFLSDEELNGTFYERCAFDNVTFGETASRENFKDCYFEGCDGPDFFKGNTKFFHPSSAEAAISNLYKDAFDLKVKLYGVRENIAHIKETTPDARPMTVAEAAKVIIAEIYRPATNEERPDWRYLSRLDLPSLRALSQGGE